MSELAERVARLARDAPDRMLVHACSEGRALSASALAAEIRIAADALARMGLGAGDLVISVAGNRSGFLSLLPACLERGVALMPVDRGATMREVRDLADRFAASAVVVAGDPDDAAAGPARACRTTALPGGLSLAVLAGVTPQPDTRRGAAVLKLTSGSTGFPKATLTTERHLVLDSEHIVAAMGITSGDTQLGTIPLSHAYGLGSLVVPLLLQGTAVVLRDSFTPAHVAADAARFGARVFPGVPFMFEHLAGHLPAEAWPGTLSLLVSAGARLDADMARGFAARFGVKIHSFYGTTETGGISYDASDDVDLGPTVGSPLPGVTVTTRPEAGAPAGTGRVHAAGEAVASGYAGEPDSRVHGFVDGGFLTGDLGRVGPDGRIELVGRVSDFVNVAGRKVQPDEVERVLRQMPGVADARVIGVADPQRGQRLVACVVARQCTLSPLAIRQFCAARLSAHKIPRGFVFVDELPVDVRGKTSRRALQALVTERLEAAGCLRET